MPADTPLVAILMGSDSDLPTLEETCKILREFAVPYEVHVASAHRTPARVMEFAGSAESRGIRVFIAAAGGAAHLAGVIAAHTVLPVIGVPMEGSLQGMDALLSTAMMPPGIPVATVAIGGAENAGLLAAQIVALTDSKLADRVAAERQARLRKVLEADAEVSAKF